MKALLLCICLSFFQFGFTDNHSPLDESIPPMLEPKVVKKIKASSWTLSKAKDILKLAKSHDVLLIGNGLGLKNNKKH